MRVSHECRENFYVSRTSSELVAEVLNMFKNFMQIFSPKYFARLLRDSHETVARYNIFKIRPKFANLSHKCTFNETATLKLCLYC